MKTPMRFLLPLLALTVTACETPQTRSIEHFIEREFLSEKPEAPIGDSEARKSAEQRCGGPVVLLPYESGQKPEHFTCIPPPA
jgi:hypothetical protein